MRFLVALSDRIMIMHHGEKIYEGSARGLAQNSTVVEVYLGKGATARLQHYGRRRGGCADRCLRPLLRVSNISAGYGRKIVIRDVSLEVLEGGAVGIVGPNGHGKTTLLNCVSAFVPLLGGEIRLSGQRLDGKPPHRIVEYGVVHIPQDNRIFPEMTVHDNLMMGAYLRKSQKGAPERSQVRLNLVSTFGRTTKAGRQHVVGRRAAHAQYWPRADDRGAAAHDR